MFLFCTDFTHLQVRCCSLSRWCPLCSRSHSAENPCARAGLREVGTTSPLHHARRRPPNYAHAQSWNVELSVSVLTGKSSRPGCVDLTLTRSGIGARHRVLSTRGADRRAVFSALRRRGRPQRTWASQHPRGPGLLRQLLGNLSHLSVPSCPPVVLHVRYRGAFFAPDSLWNQETVFLLFQPLTRVESSERCLGRRRCDSKANGLRVSNHKTALISRKASGRLVVNRSQVKTNVPSCKLRSFAGQTLCDSF